MFEILFPGVQHLQNLHPLTVHFPIAFLTGAVFFYTLACLLKKEKLASVGFWTLQMGTLAAIAAVGTGLYAEPGVMVSFSVRASLLEPHEKWMLATLALSIVLTVWSCWARPFPQKGRPFFLLLLFVLLAVMTKGADYGARMVYDYNAGGQACHQPIEFTK